MNDKQNHERVGAGYFEYAEDYSAIEFSLMDWRHRLIWIDEFIERHQLGMWLGDIRGTIGFLRDDQHFSSLSGWAAMTDGSILEAIQTGWHLYAEDGIAFTYTSGAGMQAGWGWSEFIRQLKDNPKVSEAQLIELRLIAEQMGANYGYLLANQRFQAADLFQRCKIRVFIFGADTYRHVGQLARRHGLHRVDFTGVTDPRTSWPALSLAGKLTTPLTLACVVGAGLSQLPSLMTSLTS